MFILLKLFNADRLSFPISHIAAIIGANVSLADPDHQIEFLLTDSRKLLVPNSSLFFALPGPVRKGTSYISDLYRLGVRHYVIQEAVNDEWQANYKDAVFLSVPDVLLALQQIAAAHRKQFRYPVIGITGSNGKTMIKEWLYQLLSQDEHIVRSPKSYNSQVGVPLSVWQMNANHTMGIFEAGISMRGEMEKLQPIILSTIGVIGFMGDAHAEGFDNMKEKIREKLKLFTGCKILLYNVDQTLTAEVVNEFLQHHPGVKPFCWSRVAQADLSVGNITKKDKGSIIHCRYDNLDFDFYIPFMDEASIFNAITCCALMLALKAAPTAIAVRMNALMPVEMRLELRHGINQCALINDTYNADLDSLAIALDFLSQQQQHSRRTLMLSDLMQSALPNKELYPKIASILATKKLFRFIGIGPAMMEYSSCFASLAQTHFFPDTDAFLQQMHQFHFHEETILLKGARRFTFEKISRVLEQKIHETVLEINLNALRYNLKLYRQQLKPDVKMMAMVKAFSYGSGSHEIASLLQHDGADYLAVAYADEGVDLRKAGIRLPIMVMNSTSGGFNNLLQYDLEPELYSFQLLESFLYFLRQHNISNYPVHIKLDTGMHRLGFLMEDMPALCNLLKQQQTFSVRSVFTHLAGSENPLHDDFTAKQAADFRKMADELERVLGYSFIRHMANTSAIHRHPSLQEDMVRLGIGLYGVDPALALQNVTSLRTTIAQIKKVKSGDTVGYGRKGVLTHDAEIATVRIGYADGYPRILGNGKGKMLVNRHLAPVIGNVCMDMTMLDVTGMGAEEGGDVLVFGQELPVSLLAAWAETIPYEMLTNISQRVKRVYYES
jgi:alanine racemase